MVVWSSTRTAWAALARRWGADACEGQWLVRNQSRGRAHGEGSAITPCPRFHSQRHGTRWAPPSREVRSRSAASVRHRWARALRTHCPARCNALAQTRLRHHRGDLIGAGHRRARQMLHELRTTMDLLGARGIAPLGLLALPDRDRQELVVAGIEEQIAGNETLALEGADMLRPFRYRRRCGAGLGLGRHYACIHRQLPSDVLWFARLTGGLRLGKTLLAIKPGSWPAPKCTDLPAGQEMERHD